MIEEEEIKKMMDFHMLIGGDMVRQNGMSFSLFKHEISNYLNDLPTEDDWVFDYQSYLLNNTCNYISPEEWGEDYYEDRWENMQDSVKIEINKEDVVTIELDDKCLKSISDRVFKGTELDGKVTCRDVGSMIEGFLSTFVNFNQELPDNLAFDKGVGLGKKSQNR